MIELTKEWFETRWAEARNRAGKRYTADLNIDLPIAEYFDSLTQNSTFFGRFVGLIKELEDAKTGLNLELAGC